MLEEEEEEDGNVDLSRRRNLDRVEDGDVAMTSVVLTGQSGRRHRLNTGKKLVLVANSLGTEIGRFLSTRICVGT